jgi:hypothetical protein
MLTGPNSTLNAQLLARSQKGDWSPGEVDQRTILTAGTVALCLFTGLMRQGIEESLDNDSILPPSWLEEFQEEQRIVNAFAL